MSENNEAAAGESAPVPAPQKRGSKKLVVGVIVGALAVAGAATLVSVLTQPSAITRAGEACSGSKPFVDLLNSAMPTPEAEPSGSGDTGAMDDLFTGVVSVEDEGTTLIINTAPKDDDPLGMTSLALECVYEQLDVPAHIRDRIGATRSLDGRQDGTWGDYTASWSYHRDSGANLIVVQE